MGVGCAHWRRDIARLALLPLGQPPVQFAFTLSSEMHFRYIGKVALIGRIILLVVSLATIGSSPCLADQLQWNALSTCEQAVQAIGRESLLISYCSQANEDYIELWFVRRAYIVHTPADGLFEIRVFAKCLYRSRNAFSPEEFPVSTAQWSFNKVRDPRWFVEGIDLAYVYVHTGDRSFQCLGKVLGLECLIEVETISLPSDVMEEIAPRISPGHQISLQSFDHLPAWPPRSSKAIPLRGTRY